ncbi:hairy and enhancer of split related-7 [Paramisgurnus dabryanus]|uniref:hairy and enhancer of split related-7 n=1 Tax=Paramisgurnus dabryanus TaxID=90735 RepID=UPI0031F463C0
MKMLGEPGNIKMDRKLLKPQVERRRRERMNQSLENLRTLLLQGPEHNSPNQRRMEKAEILEYTVLFLQKSIQDRAKKAKDEEETQKHQFMDGFSTCLQKASRFLLDEGEGRGIEGSVTATLCQQLTQPCVPTHIRLPVKVHRSSRTKVPDSHPQHHLQQTSVCKQRLSPVRKDVVLHQKRIPLRSTKSSTLQCQNTHTVAQSTSQHQAPVSQSVWRPWP